MHVDLTGKVALVTGAGRGIGKAIAAALARANACIVVNDVHLDTAEETANEIKALGGKALPVKADVSLREEVNDMVKNALMTFGKIDILVNNAGVITRKPAEEFLEAEWDKIINVNLKGVFLCSQIVTRHMIERGGGGKIINIASIMGGVALPPRSAYCASKGGVIALTRDLAAEWAKYNINVNAISPGWMAGTEITKLYFSQEDVRRFLLERIPLNRFGTAEDIANLVVFLSSEYSNYITGQNIYVDGGWTIL